MPKPRQRMRDASFPEKWMDLAPDIPYPKKDWIKQKWLDVSYGGHPKQKLDVYHPNANNHRLERYPLMIILHGGGFTHMDKADWDVYPGFFWLEKGYAVASVNYRLAPKHKFPAGVEDCYAAARYLIERADEYLIDKRNLFIMGPSAGGSLTLITGLRLYNGQEGADYRIKALAPLCPVTDLSSGFGSINVAFSKVLLWYMLRSYLGKSPKKGVTAPFDASFYLKETIPPIFFQLGRLDPVITVDYIETFAKKLKGKGEVVIDILEEGYHMGATKHFFLDENILRYLDFFESKIEAAAV
ncbi:MAG: alpha/beta hydrolase [Oscillospiraceae bacterium]|jgi:acetyl esterase/lipase|nr:alpha/beta hydrolase [Oscillospiraceae bacterium]